MSELNKEVVVQIVAKTKVLHIIHGFSTGGAEKIVLGYLQDFKNDDSIEIRAFSISSPTKNIFWDIIIKDKLNVVCGNYTINPKANIFKKMKDIISTIKRIDSEIRQFKPDVIHTHLHIMHLTLIPTIIRRVSKRFHTIHSKPEALSVGLFKFIDYIAFRFCKVIPVCLTNEMREKAKAFYGLNHCEVIRNGVDLGKFSVISNGKNTGRELLGIPKDAFVLGHVGRLCKTKNQTFLIDVFKEVHDRNSNAVLLLVGEGPLKGDIINKVEDLHLRESVKLLGTRDDIVTILRTMDVFVFPSIWEGLGIALIEAQAVGVRCVVSDTIPREAFVTERMIAISLNKSPKQWCDAILDCNKKGKKYLPLLNYDKNSTNADLLKLYL